MYVTFYRLNGFTDFEWEVIIDLSFILQPLLYHAH